MIVVFDTNILISALVFPGGRAEEALLRVMDGADQLLISKPLLDELLMVLAKKFGRDREQLARLAIWLSELARWIRPNRTVSVLQDDPDNRVLECAVGGGAALIVTGDKALLRLGDFEGIRIVNLQMYLSGNPD